MTVTHPTGLTFSVEVQWSTPTWTDITDDVRFCSIQTCQRSRLQQTYDPGRMVLTLDNRERQYDPLHLSGPYYGTLRPGRPIRVTVDSASASPTKYTWIGATESFALNYERSNNDGTTQLTCIDSLTTASMSQILAGSAPVLADGQNLYNRLTAIFATSTFALSVIGPGVYPTYFSAEFADIWDSTSSANMLDEIRRCADLEQAPILSSFVNNYELITHTRNWFKLNPRSATSQIVVGTGGGGLPFHDISVLFDANEIITAVGMSDESGNTVQVIDATAITTYGYRAPFQTFDRLPARNDEALEGAANTVIGLCASEEFRIDSLTIKPGGDAGWLAYLPEAELLDRITVVFTPTRTGFANIDDYFIDGITHDISPDDWTTTFSLMPCNRFDDAISGDLFIVGSSLVDGADQVGF